MERKRFLQQTVLGAGSMLTLPFFANGRSKQSEIDPLPSEKVKEFVIAGHGNFDKVKTILTELPTLLYATWDWGNGDFETALEGAGHVGNKAIAHYLIDLGSRA